MMMVYPQNTSQNQEVTRISCRKETDALNKEEEVEGGVRLSSRNDNND